MLKVRQSLLISTISCFSRYQFALSAIRTMSSESPKKSEWIIILPDQEGALGRRMDVRPQHLANLKPNVDSGFVVFGGAMLNKPVEEGSPPDIRGSIMLAMAESKEEVVAKLKEDVYVKNNVWDWEKVEIYPFISAVRKAL